MTSAAPKDASSKDAPVKAAAMSLLWSLGYVVRPELLLSEPRTRSAGRRPAYLDLTDVDVQGYMFSPLMQMQVVAVDCGTGNRRAAMDRVFWSRGLMEATGLQQGICVVGRDTEEEHRVAAHKMDVVLISVTDFKNLSTSLLGRNGAPDLGPYYAANANWLNWLAQSQTGFGDFMLRENWTREWDRLPVSLPIQIKRWGVRHKVDREDHRFTFFEAGTLLALGLVRMAAYIALVRPSDMASAVYSFVLGGGRRAGLFRSLLHRVEEVGAAPTPERTLFDREAAKNPAAEGSLPERVSVPYFEELLDVTARLVARAGAARRVPRYIQAFQLARLQGAISEFPTLLGEPLDPLVTKLALDVMRYLRLAGNYPDEMAQLLEGI